MVAQDRAGPQLPLALRHSPDQRFEGWVGAPAVLAQLQATAAGESSDSLYLQGGSGSGKTHLLLAACAAAEAAGRHANYLSLARVRGHARDALQGIEQAGLVALDDLDALAGNRDDEIALFDLHNRVRDAGVALAYAARALPGALPLQLPDLRSRLAHCTTPAVRRSFASARRRAACSSTRPRWSGCSRGAAATCRTLPRCSNASTTPRWPRNAG